MDERIIALRQFYKEKNEPILRDKTLEFLLSLIAEKKPKKMLEIGTNVGLTTTAVLMQNKDLEITSIEISEEKYLLAKSHLKEFNVYDRANLILGDANEIIPLLTGKYDFIFLDGPKGHYNEYLDYLIPCLNSGGLLFADDIDFHGYIKGSAPKKHNTIKKSLTGFIERLKESENLKTEFYEIEDGISITEKII